MSLIEMKVDPTVLQQISASLMELTQLLKAKLLADGYLKVPEPRRPTTEADITVVGEEEVWEAKKEQKAKEKRIYEMIDEDLLKAQEEIAHWPSMDSTSQVPPRLPPLGDPLADPLERLEPLETAYSTPEES